MSLPFQVLNSVLVHPITVSKICTLCAKCMKLPYYCHRFVSQPLEIFGNVNIRPPTISQRSLVTIWQTFMFSRCFCPVPTSLLFRECWFPQTPQRQRGAFVWSHSAVQITVSNQSGLHANQYPACGYWKIIRFSGIARSRMEISRFTGMS